MATRKTSGRKIRLLKKTKQATPIMYSGLQPRLQRALDHAYEKEHIKEKTITGPTIP